MNHAMEDSLRAMEIDEKLIKSFIEITSTQTEVAKFFLESHRGDLNAAVSTFKRNKAAVASRLNVQNPSEKQHLLFPGTQSLIPQSNVAVSSSSPSDYSPSQSRERSRSPPAPSPTRYPPRSNIAGNIRTFADSPGGTDNNSDKSQEFYAGVAKSGMIVQDTRKAKDSAVDLSRSTSRSFAGTRRLHCGETVSAEPEVETYTITIWKNGFTVNDSPLENLDNPENASFLENVEKLESLHGLSPVHENDRTRFKVIRRQEEDFIESPKPNTLFQGVGRTLGGSSSSSFVVSVEPPSMELVVDPAKPITSIQIRLADGTRLVTRFNTHHTVRDVRGFVDASTPRGGSRDYQLLIMGFPPKPLLDFDQTIEDAGVANAVLIQKY